MSAPDFKAELAQLVSDWYFRRELYEWLRKTLRVKYSTDVIRFYIEEVFLGDRNLESLNTYQLWKHTKLEEKPKQNPPKNTFYLRTVPYLVELGFIERHGLRMDDAGPGDRKEDLLRFNEGEVLLYIYYLARYLKDTE